MFGQHPVQSSIILHKSNNSFLSAYVNITDTYMFRYYKPRPKPCGNNGITIFKIYSLNHGLIKIIKTQFIKIH